jgi:hypothetical protein
MVEAAGVEPAFEINLGRETPCVVFPEIWRFRDTLRNVSNQRGNLPLSEYSPVSANLFHSQQINESWEQKGEGNQKVVETDSPFFNPNSTQNNNSLDLFSTT